MGWRGIFTIAMFVWIAISFVGCGGRPPTGARVVTVPGEISAESLRVAISGRMPPTSFRGDGSLRLRVGDEDLPTLRVRFALQDAQALRLLLRPGVLSPVMSLWASGEDWILHLPRDRVAVDPRSGGEAADLPTGRMLARLGWYLLVPHGLLQDLRQPSVVDHGEHWILLGEPRVLGPSVPRAEVWIEKEQGRVTRWTLWSREGEPLVQVTFQPSRAAGVPAAPEGSVEIRVPSLETRGVLHVRRQQEEPVEPTPRPTVPEGWNLMSERELQRRLRRLVEADR